MLEAEDANGARSEANAVVSVEGQMKVGNFSLAFEDLTVELAGLPITLTRTYDSRARGRDGVFGYGWNLGYQGVRLQESGRAGRDWQVNGSAGCSASAACSPTGIAW